MKRNAEGQFVKDEPDFINGDYEELQHAIFVEENSDEARSAEEQREIENRENERSVELEFLGRAETLEEFRQAREHGHIRYPAPLSEDMSLEEFSKARRQR